MKPIVLNFSHPLTQEQLAQLEAIFGQAIAECRNIPVQMDQARSFVISLGLDNRMATTH